MSDSVVKSAETTHIFSLSTESHFRLVVFFLNADYGNRYNRLTHETRK